MTQIKCDGPMPEDESCSSSAVYNLMRRCCGGDPSNVCWTHVGPALTGWILAWQSGIPPCPHCGHKQEHLEDAVMLTSIGPGLTLEEAWDRFKKEEQQ